MTEKYYFAFILLICSGLSLAQVPNLDPVQTVNTATGEMQFALPLGKVVGTGGLDFPVNLCYQAGIRTQQVATPAGLGFDVSAGSITRKKIFVADQSNESNYSTLNISPPCDLDTWVVVVQWIAMALTIVISVVAMIVTNGGGSEFLIGALALASTMVTATGYIVNGVTSGPSDYRAGGLHTPSYQSSEGKGVGYLKGGSATDLPDMYFVNTPYISGNIIYINNKYKFMPLSGTNVGNVQVHYIAGDIFKLILADGTRLLFEKHNLVDFETTVEGNTRVGSSDCHYETQTREENEIDQWYLTKVLSSDFNGDETTPQKTDIGNWIKINYQTFEFNSIVPDLNEGVRYQFSPREAGEVNIRVRKINFLSEIITSNESFSMHYICDRLDNTMTSSLSMCRPMPGGFFDETVLMPRLDYVEFKNVNGEQYRKINFNTDYILRPNTVGSRDKVDSDPIGTSTLPSTYRNNCSYCRDGSCPDLNRYNSTSYSTIKNGVYVTTDDAIKANPLNSSLTLMSIQISVKNENLPLIKFKYNGTSNPQLSKINDAQTRDGPDKERFTIEDKDLWGYYNPSGAIAGNKNDFNIYGDKSKAERPNGTAYADAWSLSEINFPDGKSILWHYEAQRYANANGIAVKKNSSNQNISKYGGGIRVHSIEVKNSLNSAENINYSYFYTNTDGVFSENAYNSSGHATCEPFPYTDAATPNEDPREKTTRGGLYTSAKVVYEKVQIVTSTGYSIVETYTSKDFPNSGAYGDVDNSWQRGFLKRYRQFNTNGTLISDYYPKYRWKKDFNTAWSIRIEDGNNGWISFGTVEKINDESQCLNLKKEKKYFYSTDVNPVNDKPTNDPDISSFDTTSYLGSRIPLTAGNVEVKFAKTTAFNGNKDDIIIGVIQKLSNDFYLKIAIATDIDYGLPVLSTNVTQYRTLISDAPTTHLLGIDLFDWDMNGQNDIIVQSTKGYNRPIRIDIVLNPQIISGSILGLQTTIELNHDINAPAVCGTILDVDNNNKPDILCGLSKLDNNMSLVCYLNASDVNPQARLHYIRFIENDEYTQNININKISHMSSNGKRDFLLTFQNDAGHYVQCDGYAGLGLGQIETNVGIAWQRPGFKGRVAWMLLPYYISKGKIKIPYVEQSKNNPYDKGWVFGGVLIDGKTMLAQNADGFTVAKEISGSVQRDYDGQPNQIVTVTSKSDLIIDVPKPVFFNNTEFKTKNMLVQNCENVKYQVTKSISLPIKPDEWKNSVVSGIVKKYEAIDNNWVPIANYLWKADFLSAGLTTSKTFLNYDFAIGAFNNDWQLVDSVCKVTKYFNPIEVAMAGVNNKRIFNNVIYGYGSKYPIATINNCRFDECAIFTGDYDDNIISDHFDKENGWEKGGGALSPAFSFCGTYSLYVYNNYGPTKNAAFNPSLDHTFSAQILHVPDGDAMSKTKYVKMAVELHSAIPVPGEVAKTAIGSWHNEITDLKDGWNLYEYTLKATDLKNHLDAGHVPSDVKYVRIWIGNDPKSNTSDPKIADVHINDIRFYPSNAIVNTTYYDSDFGLPIVSVDANNKPGIKTTYDGFGRPVLFQKYDLTKKSTESGYLTTVEKKEYHLMGTNDEPNTPSNLTYKISYPAIELTWDCGDPDPDQLIKYKIDLESIINGGGGFTTVTTAPSLQTTINYTFTPVSIGEGPYRCTISATDDFGCTISKYVGNIIYEE